MSRPQGATAPWSVEAAGTRDSTPRCVPAGRITWPPVSPAQGRATRTKEIFPAKPPSARIGVGVVGAGGRCGSARACSPTGATRGRQSGRPGGDGRARERRRRAGGGLGSNRTSGSGGPAGKRAEGDDGVSARLGHVTPRPARHSDGGGADGHTAQSETLGQEPRRIRNRGRGRARTTVQSGQGAGHIAAWAPAPRSPRCPVRAALTCRAAEARGGPPGARSGAARW